MTNVTPTRTLSSTNTIIIWIIDTKLHLRIMFSHFRVGHVDSVFVVIVIVSDERERWGLFVVVIIIFTDEESRSISQKLMLGMITVVITFDTASWNTWGYYSSRTQTTKQEPPDKSDESSSFAFLLVVARSLAFLCCRLAIRRDWCSIWIRELSLARLVRLVWIEIEYSSSLFRPLFLFIRWINAGGIHHDRCKEKRQHWTFWMWQRSNSIQWFLKKWLRQDRRPKNSWAGSIVKWRKLLPAGAVFLPGDSWREGRDAGHQHIHLRKCPAVLMSRPFVPINGTFINFVGWYMPTGLPL